MCQCKAMVRRQLPFCGDSSNNYIKKKHKKDDFISDFEIGINVEFVINLIFPTLNVFLGGYLISTLIDLTYLLFYQTFLISFICLWVIIENQTIQKKKKTNYKRFINHLVTNSLISSSHWWEIHQTKVLSVLLGLELFPSSTSTLGKCSTPG